MNQLEGNVSRETALLTALRPTPQASEIFLRPTASAKAFAVIMDTKYPHQVDQCKPTNGRLQKTPQFVNCGGMAKEDAEFAEIGMRLTRVRQGFSDLNQKAWAERHGFNHTQYNNWERGIRRISVESAEALCAAYGLTLDWIYRGRRDGLAESASKVL